MLSLPVLLPDVEVSRNLRRHALTIPGESTSFVFASVQLALESILAHGFTEFVLHVGSADYLCSPAQRSLLDQLERDRADDLDPGL